MSKPQPEEHAPYYAAYISRIGDGDIIDILSQQQTSADSFLKSIPHDKADYAYAEGKWTIKQVIGHLIDTERIMTYRLLRFARNDQSDLKGFDQDAYAASAQASGRGLDELTEEFFYLRKANLYLFRSLNDKEKMRSGTANGHTVTVNALLYIIAGHVDHHLDILTERY